MMAEYASAISRSVGTMAQLHYYNRVQRIAYGAIAAGALLKSGRYVEWRIAGKCADPKLVELTGQKTRLDLADKAARVDPDWKPGLRIHVDLHVRCRRCENCRRVRQMDWHHRALAEWRAAPRTWLVTLTLSEQEHWKFSLLADRARKQAIGEEIDPETGEVKAAPEWTSLPMLERFRRCDDEIRRELTKYLKRLRNGSPKGGTTYRGEHFKQERTAFRYCLVSESHHTTENGVKVEDGRPHYHLMVYELPGRAPLSRRWLEACWPFGTIKDAKLVLDERGAVYATKYLGKTNMARVRASIGFGQKTVFNHSKVSGGGSPNSSNSETHPTPTHPTRETPTTRANKAERLPVLFTPNERLELTGRERGANVRLLYRGGELVRAEAHPGKFIPFFDDGPFTDDRATGTELKRRH